MSALTGGGGGAGLPGHREPEGPEIVDFSVITRALQGDCLKPDEKHGLERLSRAMAKKGYCAIALGDNDTARDIRGHVNHMMGVGKAWNKLPAQREPGEYAISQPLYHGYLSASDSKEVVDLRIGQGATSDSLLTRLPMGLPAFRAMEMIARTVLQVVCKGLGMRNHHLETELLDSYPLPEGQWSSSILSSLHYTTHGLEGQAKVIVAPRHVDMGLLTVGYSEMPGMQVWGGNGDQWVDLPCGPTIRLGQVKQVVWVIAGSTLERATGGAIKAVEHRVVCPPETSRYSLVFKLRGDPSAMIDTSALAKHIRVPTPDLDRFRQPMRVRAFEEEFRRQHPSITYPTPQRLTEGPTTAASSSSASSSSTSTSALSAVQGPGGARPRGQKRESTELTGEEDGIMKTKERPSTRPRSAPTNTVSGTAASASAPPVVTANQQVDHYELAADKEEVANSPGKWCCKACTMLNERISQRCSICGSSRHHKPSPPRSGGAQHDAEKQHDAASASAEAARPSAGGGSPITVIFKFVDGSQVVLKMPRDTVMKKAFDMYKVVAGHDEREWFRYFLNGNRVQSHETPADLGYDPARGDVIDVMFEWQGD